FVDRLASLALPTQVLQQGLEQGGARHLFRAILRDRRRAGIVIRGVEFVGHRALSRHARLPRLGADSILSRPRIRNVLQLLRIRHLIAPLLVVPALWAGMSR